MCECQDIMAARRKSIVLECARKVGSVSKACREIRVPRASFYRWRAAFAREDVQGLRRKRARSGSSPCQTS